VAAPASPNTSRAARNRDPKATRKRRGGFKSTVLTPLANNILEGRKVEKQSFQQQPTTNDGCKSPQSFANNSIRERGTLGKICRLRGLGKIGTPLVEQRLELSALSTAAKKFSPEITLGNLVQMRRLKMVQ